MIMGAGRDAQGISPLHREMMRRSESDVPRG